jgi:hypothetical protein
VGAKMKIAVVTSCSAAGYDAYGARFLQSLDQYWPLAVSLYVVSEDALSVPEQGATGRTMHFLSLANAPPPVGAFYVRHIDNAAARGAGKLKGFRWDAWKFSKKIFAINMAAHHTDVDLLMWVDADVVTFAPVPFDLLKTLPPSHMSVAYLDRGKYHSECGFVSYNLRGPTTLKFIDEMQRVYTSDAVFSLAEWNDCFVFDWVRQRMHVLGYKIPHKSTGHPFVHSVLGKYMDHLKGRRKDRGFSPEHPRFKGKAS